MHYARIDMYLAVPYIPSNLVHLVQGKTYHICDGLWEIKIRLTRINLQGQYDPLRVALGTCCVLCGLLVHSIVSFGRWVMCCCRTDCCADGFGAR